MQEGLGSGAMPAPVALLQMLFASFVSKALATAAELDIAERLAREPRSAADLARDVDANPLAVHRFLRALASVGVFREGDDGRFSNTELSQLLRADVPGSMRSAALFICGSAHWSAWNELPYSLRTGRSAFERVHGRRPFDYMKGDPEFGAVFNDAMTKITHKETEAILEHLDLSRVRTLVDVGGGQGALLKSCLERFPELRGVLFDTEEVISSNGSAVVSSEVASRCEVVAGNFFESVPANGDAYMMKYILHDWSDEEALTILGTLHRSSRPGAKVFIMDPVVKPGNHPDFVKLLDLQVLAFYGGGRERTLAELKDLLVQAKFRFERAIETTSFITIVEAVRE